MTFAELGLNPALLRAIEAKGYTTPSPIQEKAIPAVLTGQDVLAAAQTGTGKTAGFTLPILEILSRGKHAQGNHVRALILTPTRELAAQVGDNVTTYGKFLPLSSAVVFGGVKVNPQMMRMRKGVDILVATPGRLLDLYNQGAIKFGQLEVLVLDEADRMLDMGFIHDIRKIMNLLPKVRQNLLFSATFSDDIRNLAKTIVHQPIEVSTAVANTTVKKIEQWIIPVDKKQKTPILTKLIKENQWQQVLVFSRTKHGANKIAAQLETAGIRAAAIHGNKSQGARTKALADFKSGNIRALIATDIAARGIDIDQLPHVVNFDLPNVSEDYVHRIGRTGRAGATGEALSLVCIDEMDCLEGIESLIGELIPRKYIDGFKPIHDLPASVLKAKKKPKKSKASKELAATAPNNANAATKKPNHTKWPNRKPAANATNGNQPAKSGEQTSNRVRAKPAPRKPSSNNSPTNSGAPSRRRTNP